MENDVDYERVILIIDRAALENTLSAIIGKPIGSSLKMIPTQIIGNHRRVHCGSTLCFSWDN